MSVFDVFVLMLTLMPTRALMSSALRAPVRIVDRRASSPYCSSTRSTARDEEERFASGAPARALRLKAALRECGFDDEALHELLHGYASTAARRTYLSFVYPKSEGALANAEKPGRHEQIARQISFLEREARADATTWLRNHDRALAQVGASTRHPLHLVLDNVRSAHNVGNLLRAAEAARLEAVHCCGITPTPPEPKLLKTAMGAADYVPYSHEGSTLRVVRALQASGVAVWACETSERSVDLRRTMLPQPLALVLGNELIGVDTQILDIADGIVEIPCFGVKNSLNVATAGSIVIWEALRQWEGTQGARRQDQRQKDQAREPGVDSE